MMSMHIVYHKFTSPLDEVETELCEMSISNIISIRKKNMKMLY